VLPALTRALGKGALACVARSAAIAGEDERYLERRAGKAFARLFAPKGGALEGEAGALCRLHPALRRRVLRRAARALGASLGASHVEAIERALGAAGPARLTLPRGFECRIAYGRIVLAKAEERARAQPFAQRIDGPGEGEAGGFVVEVRPVAGPATAGAGNTLRVDPERVALPLWLRSRRPGDRYRPRGGHEKKLKALFIDQKIPRAERDRLPLLCDDAGRVLWALGLRPSDAAAQGERSRKAWLICVRASEASPRALLEGKAGETGPKRGAK